MWTLHNTCLNSCNPSVMEPEGGFALLIYFHESGRNWSLSRLLQSQFLLRSGFTCWWSGLWSTVPPQIWQEPEMGPLCIPRPLVPHPPLAPRSIIGGKKNPLRGETLLCRQNHGSTLPPLSWESPRQLPCIVFCLQRMNKCAVDRQKHAHIIQPRAIMSSCVNGPHRWLINEAVSFVKHLSVGTFGEAGGAGWKLSSPCATRRKLTNSWMYRIIQRSSVHLSALRIKV